MSMFENERYDQYVRPSGLFNKQLGPLPYNARALSPTIDEMQEVESHNTLLVFMCIGAYTVMFSSMASMPFLIGGITTLWTGPIHAPDSAQFGFAQIVAILYIGSLIIFRKKLDHYAYRNTIGDAQKFYMGSENWTWSQRGYSYLAAILPSVFLFLFYPAPTIFIFWIPVPVASRLYLNTYKKTGDMEYATLVAAKFSWRFSKYFLLLILALALLPWIMTLVS